MGSRFWHKCCIYTLRIVYIWESCYHEHDELWTRVLHSYSIFHIFSITCYGASNKHSWFIFTVLLGTQCAVRYASQQIFCFSYEVMIYLVYIFHLKTIFICLDFFRRYICAGCSHFGKDDSWVLHWAHFLLCDLEKSYSIPKDLVSLSVNGNSTFL